MSDFPKVVEPVNYGGGIRTRSSGSRTCFLVLSTIPRGVGPIGLDFLKFFISSKVQQIVDKVESLLSNKTLWEEKRDVASWATNILQETESNVLKTALKTPNQNNQRGQTSTVGKKRARRGAWGWFLAGAGFSN